MSQTTAGRRKISFRDFDGVAEDVDQLNDCGYIRLGNWSLPQICWHLGKTITDNLKQPQTQTATPEETARKNGFFALAFGPTGFPERMPLPPTLDPPPDLGPEEIENLKSAMRQLSACPHRCIQVGGCGPVPVEDVVRLHLAHAAHHLSFLIPSHASSGQAT